MVLPLAFLLSYSESAMRVLMAQLDLNVAVFTRVNAGLLTHSRAAAGGLRWTMLSLMQSRIEIS